VELTVTPAACAKIEFVQMQPTSTVAGDLFATFPTVELRDLFGNHIFECQPVVEISAVAVADDKILTGDPARSPVPIPVRGTLRLPAYGGVAVFHDVSITVASAQPIQFRITSDGFLSALSVAFYITPAAAAACLFIAQPPQNTVAGRPFRIVAALADAFGNSIAATTTISMTLQRTVAADALLELSGRTVNRSASGTVEFNDIAVLRAQPNLRLIAVSGVFTAESELFSVSSEAAAALAFTMLPASGTEVGRALEVQPALSLVDKYGNLVDEDKRKVDAVTLVAVLESDQAVWSQATLMGSSKVAFSADGIARFSDITFRTSGRYTLQAILPGYAPAMSEPIVVLHGEPTNLRFLRQPSEYAVVFEELVVQPVVTVHDAYGNLATSARSLRSVRLEVNAPNITRSILGRGVSSFVDGGVSMFKEVQFAITGEAFRLTAASGALESALSQPVAVMPKSFPRLRFMNDPPSKMFANDPFPAAFSVEMVDAVTNTRLDTKARRATRCSACVAFHGSCASCTMLSEPNVLDVLVQVAVVTLSVVKVKTSIGDKPSRPLSAYAADELLVKSDPSITPVGRLSKLEAVDGFVTFPTVA
jgi:hypothetical protein